MTLGRIPAKTREMALDITKILFLCFAFLLTQNARAETDSFGQAQKFFSESQQATKNYLRSGKGLEDIETTNQPAYRNPNQNTFVNPNASKSAPVYNTPKTLGRSTRYNIPHSSGSVPTYNTPNSSGSSPTYNTPSNSPNYNSPNGLNAPSSNQAPLNTYGYSGGFNAQNHFNGAGTSVYQNPEGENKLAVKKALYFSLMSQTINGASSDAPTYGLSAAISVPVYSSSLMFLNTEFQFSGDVKNASEWGQVQFIQKESFSIWRNQQTLIEFFFGMGFGYGHGSEIVSNQRFYAPWATGLQWGKSNRIDPAFYRFEVGWTGDFYFLNNNYNQGLLVNVSLGYKL